MTGFLGHRRSRRGYFIDVLWNTDVVIIVWIYRRNWFCLKYFWFILMVFADLIIIWLFNVLVFIILVCLVLYFSEKYIIIRKYFLGSIFLTLVCEIVYFRMDRLWRWSGLIMKESRICVGLIFFMNVKFTLITSMLSSGSAIDTTIVARGWVLWSRLLGRLLVPHLCHLILHGIKIFSR